MCSRSGLLIDLALFSSFFAAGAAVILIRVGLDPLTALVIAVALFALLAVGAARLATLEHPSGSLAIGGDRIRYTAGRGALGRVDARLEDVQRLVHRPLEGELTIWVAEVPPIRIVAARLTRGTLEDVVRTIERALGEARHRELLERTNEFYRQRRRWANMLVGVAVALSALALLIPSSS